jgi:hypothetical protein
VLFWTVIAIASRTSGVQRKALAGHVLDKALTCKGDLNTVQALLLLVTWPLQVWDRYHACTVTRLAWYMMAMATDVGIHRAHHTHFRDGSAMPLPDRITRAITWVHCLIAYRK